MTITIIDLPFDVLYIIFVLCWDKNWIRKQPFPVVASHVCRRWRHYALETPSFWANLTFRDSRPQLEKYATWLERSGKSPLGFVFGAQPFQQRSVKNLKDIMQLILPHSNRWRFLYIFYIPYKITRMIFDRLLNVPMPGLTNLEVMADDLGGRMAASGKWRFRPFLRGGAPNLREMTINRLSYEHINARFQSLVVLDIFDRDIALERASVVALKIHHLLSRLPQLQILRLRSGVFNPRRVNGGAVQSLRSDSAPPLTHPSLVELSIQGPPKTINAIIPSLILPQVRYFLDRTRSGPDQWEITLDISCLRVLANSHPFPNLISIRLGGNSSLWRLPDPVSNRPPSGGHLSYLQAALVGLPSLRALTFEQIDWQNGQYLRCLARVCPQLQWLTFMACTGYTFAEIQSICEERQKLETTGLIKRLAICGLQSPTQSPTELEAMKWLDKAFEFVYKPGVGPEELQWDYLSNVEKLS
ncbi:hypothetical protein FRC04_005392 [Tulasnella sp. 424]|nr:hypothetical protein FRC04_005392 [Tulasnella sp. 424]KAG8964780.1 hypothetical protein FRC05_003570 [Tulasnella sp. 425]